MNLLMIAPLLDSRGILRYYIGAQVDVSNLVKESTGLDAFKRMLDVQQGIVEPEEPKDEFQELSEMFNNAELDTVRKHGGNMHRDHVEDERDDTSTPIRPRLLIKDPSNGEIETPIGISGKPDGRLSGVYKHVSEPHTPRMSSINTLIVSDRSAASIASHSLYIAISPRPWHPSVTLSRPHRRLFTSTYLGRRSPGRWYSRRHSKDPLALISSTLPRTHSRRRRPAALDSLHASSRPIRGCWRLDGRLGRRRQIPGSRPKIPASAPGRKRRSTRHTGLISRQYAQGRDQRRRDGRKGTHESASEWQPSTIQIEAATAQHDE